jgi:sugar transferase (PEP-CTERM/EpsH1 system associated)
MKKIKVVYLVEDLKLGGLERLIEDICLNLNHERYAISVWCFNALGMIGERLVQQGVDVRVLHLKSCYHPLAILRLRRLLKTHAPDIIHTHTYFGNTLGRLAGILAGVPVKIVHVHGIYSHYRWPHYLMERSLSLFTQQIVCCSKAVRQFALTSEKISSRKVKTIYNGIQIERFDVPINRFAIREALGLKEKEKVIITVGSLRWVKGYKYFLESMVEVNKKKQDARCLIVGEGLLRRDLEEKVRCLGLDGCVQFLGLRTDIPELLGCADIFVLSSLVEGLPLAVIEACAAGLPVIATDVGGVSEIIENGVTGILVPSKDIQALQQAIVTLLDDPEQARLMGEAGKRMARQKFSLEIMMRNIENLYQSLYLKKVV